MQKLFKSATLGAKSFQNSRRGSVLATRNEIQIYEVPTVVNSSSLEDGRNLCSLIEVHQRLPLKRVVQHSSVASLRRILRQVGAKDR